MRSESLIFDDPQSDDPSFNDPHFQVLLAEVLYSSLPKVNPCYDPAPLLFPKEAWHLVYEADSPLCRQLEFKGGVMLGGVIDQVVQELIPSSFEFIVRRLLHYAISSTY